jgi:hypothetical protein
MLQRSSGFLPRVHTTIRVGFGVLSVKPDCHSSDSIRNLLVYLPPAHRVKKTRYSLWSVFVARSADSPDRISGDGRCCECGNIRQLVNGERNLLSHEIDATRPRDSARRRKC